MKKGTLVLVVIAVIVILLGFWAFCAFNRVVVREL